MNQITRIKDLSEEALHTEGRRILRRLAEPGACLALAPGMETAVVVRDAGEEPPVRTAVVRREIAEAMALREWIESYGSGRILRYAITSTGRAALRRLIAEDENAREQSGRAQEAGPNLFDSGTDDSEARRSFRYSLAESPILVLSRRRDKDGSPFLSPELVAAGERFREDFEIAQMGDDARDALRSLLDGASPDVLSDIRAKPASRRALHRLKDALFALGPGLSDVALRSCCYLEGMETIERTLGWSARSGKIVLRIALQRLRYHYDETSENWSPLIG